MSFRELDSTITLLDIISSRHNNTEEYLVCNQLLILYKLKVILGSLPVMSANE